MKTSYNLRFSLQEVERGAINLGTGSQKEDEETQWLEQNKGHVLCLHNSVHRQGTGDQHHTSYG